VLDFGAFVEIEKASRASSTCRNSPTSAWRNPKQFVKPGQTLKSRDHLGWTALNGDWLSFRGLHAPKRWADAQGFSAGVPTATLGDVMREKLAALAPKNRPSKRDCRGESGGLARFTEPELFARQTFGPTKSAPPSGIGCQPARLSARWSASRIHSLELVVRDGAVVGRIGFFAAANWTDWDAADLDVLDRMTMGEGHQATAVGYHQRQLAGRRARCCQQAVNEGNALAERAMSGLRLRR